MAKAATSGVHVASVLDGASLKDATAAGVAAALKGAAGSAVSGAGARGESASSGSGDGDGDSGGDAGGGLQRRKDYMCLSMEFCDGGSLYDIVDKAPANRAPCSAGENKSESTLKSSPKSSSASSSSSSSFSSLRRGLPQGLPVSPPTHPLTTGGLPLGTVVEIYRQVCSALEFAHRHGVVHCDIKLENVMLKSVFPAPSHGTEHGHYLYTNSVWRNMYTEK
jgi:hypothetical protein